MFHRFITTISPTYFASKLHQLFGGHRLFYIIHAHVMATSFNATFHNDSCIILGIKKNCAEIDDALNAHGHPLVAFCSFSSLICNGIILVVIASKLRKNRDSIKPAAIHLSTLALSDLSIGFVYIFGAALSWSSDSGEMDGSFSAWIISLVFTHTINRWLTMYITFARAKAVTFTGAMRVEKQTAKRCCIETLIFGVLGSIPLFLICASLVKILQLFEVPEPFAVGCLIVYPILILTMLIMASLILIKTGRNSRNSMEAVVSEARSQAMMQFQRQVATVALVFCACHSLSLVRNGLIAFHPQGTKFTVNLGLDVGNAFLYMFNSTVNLFIYLLVSKTFRDNFHQTLQLS